MDKSILNRTIDISWLLPPVSRDSRDIQQVAQTENAEFQDTWSALCYIFGEQFIDSMEGHGLEQWEAIFDVMPKSDDSTESRRQRILWLIAGTRPYTRKSVQAMLDSMFGTGNVVLNVNNNAYECWLDVAGAHVYLINEILGFIEPIIPKNLLIFFRNTKKAKGAYHIGGYITLSTHIHIMANTDVAFSAFTVKKSTRGYISESGALIHIKGRNL